MTRPTSLPSSQAAYNLLLMILNAADAKVVPSRCARGDTFNEINGFASGSKIVVRVAGGFVYRNRTTCDFLRTVGRQNHLRTKGSTCNFQRLLRCTHSSIG